MNNLKRLGPQAMTMHLQGKPHLKKIEHYLMEDSKLSWCPICSVPLSSLKQAYSHCMSKQHCEKLVRSQQQPGDINSSQNNQGNGKRKVKFQIQLRKSSLIELNYCAWFIYWLKSSKIFSLQYHNKRNDQQQGKRKFDFSPTPLTESPLFTL